MECATQWLRNLLGGKKNTKNTNNKNINNNGNNGCKEDKRVKKRWSFTRDCNVGIERTNHLHHPRTTTTKSSAWLHSFYSASEKEQSKSTIAVTTATVTAVDAAIAAAQAAVAVLRLTNQGCGAMFLGVQEHHAAVKIQTAFRGSLERMDEFPREVLGQFHSWRMSDASSNSFDRSPKAAEINIGHPESGSVTFPLPCHILGRMLIPEHKDYQDFANEKCRSPITPESTLSCMNLNSMATPITPAKSVNAADGVSRRFLNSSNRPNYMAYTQSFEAKVQSQSTPKQSSEPVVSLSGVGKYDLIKS